MSTETKIDLFECHLASLALESTTKDSENLNTKEEFSDEALIKSEKLVKDNAGISSVVTLKNECNTDKCVIAQKDSSDEKKGKEIPANKIVDHKGINALIENLLISSQKTSVMADDNKLLKSDCVCVERKILRLIRDLNCFYYDYLIKKKIEKFKEIPKQLKSSVIKPLEDEKNRNEALKIEASTSKMEKSTSASFQGLKLDQSNIIFGNSPFMVSINHKKVLAKQLSFLLRTCKKAIKGLNSFDRVLSEPLQQMNASPESYGIGGPSHVSASEDSKSEVETGANISEDSSRKQKMENYPCIVRISRKKFLKIKKSVENSIFSLEQWLKEIECEIENSREEIAKRIRNKIVDKLRKRHSFYDFNKTESSSHGYFDLYDLYDELLNELDEFQKAAKISKQRALKSELNQKVHEFLEEGSPGRISSLLPQSTAADDQHFFEYFEKKEVKEHQNEGLRKKLSESKPSFSNQRLCTDLPEIIVQVDETPKVINMSVELNANYAENKRNPNIKPAEFISHPTDPPEIYVQANKASKMNASKEFNANYAENKLSKNIKSVDFVSKQEHLTDQPEITIQDDEISEAGITSKKLNANDAENESNMNQEISAVEFINTQGHHTNQAEITIERNETRETGNTSKELSANDAEKEHTVNQTMSSVEENTNKVAGKSDSNDTDHDSNDNNSLISTIVSYPSEYCSIQ